MKVFIHLKNGHIITTDKVSKVTVEHSKSSGHPVGWNIVWNNEGDSNIVYIDPSEIVAVTTEGK